MFLLVMNSIIRHSRTFGIHEARMSQTHIDALNLLDESVFNQYCYICMHTTTVTTISTSTHGT